MLKKKKKVLKWRGNPPKDKNLIRLYNNIYIFNLMNFIKIRGYIKSKPN